MRTNMPARWFRMYAEFATDPKVQMLSETDQRRFIMLLCLRCSNGGETLQEQQIAFQLRISVQEWTCTREILYASKLIDGNAHPLAWEKRQCPSDVSTSRVYKHREKVKRERNESETLQQRPRVEKSKEEIKQKPLRVPRGADLFNRFWTAYPLKKAKGRAERAFEKIDPDEQLATRMIVAVERAKTSEQWRKGFVPYGSTWLNDRGWEDEELEAPRQMHANAVDETGLVV